MALWRSEESGVINWIRLQQAPTTSLCGRIRQCHQPPCSLLAHFTLASGYGFSTPIPRLRLCVNLSEVTRAEILLWPWSAAGGSVRTVLFENRTDKPAVWSGGVSTGQSDNYTGPLLNLIQRNLPQSNVTWPNKSNLVTVTVFGNLYEEINTVAVPGGASVLLSVSWVRESDWQGGHRGNTLKTHDVIIMRCTVTSL